MDYLYKRAKEEDIVDYLEMALRKNAEIAGSYPDIELG
jgi:hypothetical protein